MKKLLLLALLLHSAISHGQVAGTTLVIEKLSPPKGHLYQSSARQAVEYWDANVEKTSPLPDSLVCFGSQPLLAAFVTAYKGHRPIVLSPDMVWLLISQGFARHVCNNAEMLRQQLVGFEGKKQLTVFANDIQLGNPASSWEAVFPQFNQQIADYTGPELVQVLTSNFSTTTPTTRLASQMTIMESVKSYFEYHVAIVGCGLPQVTLEGSPADWEEVLRKTRYLGRYQLEWWTKELEPVLEELILTAQGRGKPRFWMNMVRVHTPKSYGARDVIDGWLVKFYPYTKKGQRTNLQSVKNLADLAPETVRVPFLLHLAPGGPVHKMEFQAGFIGARQDRRTYALRPEIAWAVVNKQGPNRNVNEFDYLANMDELAISNVREIPGELYAVKHVHTLRIAFLGDIVLPPELGQLRIDVLRLEGRIAHEQVPALRARFPHTAVFINGAGE